MTGRRRRKPKRARREPRPRRPPSRAKAKPSPLLNDSDEHTIPTPLPDHVLSDFTLGSPEHEERRIREYVESQAVGERVVHLEKLKTERLRTRTLDAWDVRTDRDRYWVITNPTNLYSHKHFPSLDFTISAHVGITERVFDRQTPPTPPAERHRLASAWRTWDQAAATLDDAEEAEEFQSIGMRCRDALLDLAEGTARAEMVREGEETPQRDNFLAWKELIANAIAGGKSAERVRQYLKAVSEETWKLVGWLTHAKNATWGDARLAVDATRNVLHSFGAAVLRYETGAPDRCPECASYRVTIDYRSDIGIEVPLCEECGWTLLPSIGDDSPPPSL
jgi:hypothetical protein